MGFDSLFEDMGVRATTRPKTTLDPKYTRHVKAPLYTPSGECPSVHDLHDDRKVRELRSRILQSDCPESIKEFLLKAADRHRVFDYAKIAEYYAHAPKGVQELFEDSALVIIDLDAAIEKGYTRLIADLDSIAEGDADARG